FALELEPDKLGQEANRALERIGGFHSLIGILPRVPAKPDWSLCSDHGLSFSLLGQGLFHPSFIVKRICVCVLSESWCRMAAQEQVLRALETGRRQTLLVVSWIVGNVWPDSAFEMILT